MHIENLIEKFKLKDNIDLDEATFYDDSFWGHSFCIDVSDFEVNTFKQRVELIDKATEMEHQRLMSQENSWAITGLKKIGENWKEFDFDYGKEMLLNAIRYDLAYKSSQRLSLDIAQKFYDFIIFDYKDDNTFVYCNYNKSPWAKKSGGYGGWSLTDDWTFDLGIVLINSNKLTFNYFLIED